MEISQKSVRTVQFTQHHNNTSDIGTCILNTAYHVRTNILSAGFKVQPDLRNLGSITHVIVESVVPGSQAYRNGKYLYKESFSYITVCVSIVTAVII